MPMSQPTSNDDHRDASENTSTKNCAAQPHSIRSIADGLGDVAYYLGQAASGAMEVDSGFFDRARAFTEEYLGRAQTWLDQRANQSEDPSGEYVQAHHRGRIADLLGRVRNPSVTLNSLHEIAQAARDFAQLLSLASG